MAKKVINKDNEGKFEKDVHGLSSVHGLSAAAWSFLRGIEEKISSHLRAVDEEPLYFPGMLGK